MCIYFMLEKTPQKQGRELARCNTTQQRVGFGNQENATPRPNIWWPVGAWWDQPNEWCSSRG